MRNILINIRRYFVLIAFVLLQLIALWMLFRYNRLHRAVFLGAANQVTGSINAQVDKVDDYFHLRDENRRVHRINDSLMNLLRSNFSFPDTAQRFVVDSIRVDTTRGTRRYLFREAKVVFNSVLGDRNYLQLNRGVKQGIRDNMAVLSSDGSLVGLVVNVSNNFSQVMSLLHKQSRVPASLKRTNVYGTIEWDGEDPRFVTLRGISRDVEVKNGDSVMTSVYSYNFPPGYLVGRVAQIQPDKGSGFYVLKVRTAVDFNAVQHVFVVENLEREEQLRLEEETRKKIEQQKRS